VLPKVQLFGEPKALAGKKEHRFQPSRRYQLLAYLAYTNSRVSREKLADVFWSHTDSQAARRNLRKVLFEAKNLEWALGFDHDEGGASWQVETDVAAFEEAVKQKQWSEAIALYTGSFLDGLQSNDGAEFDAWLEGERLRLDELYQVASENFVETLERQGKLEEAVAFLKQHLARDSLNETLHRNVMRLEFKQGNSEAALEQFERCREVLQKELGVEPLPETLELLKTIEQGGGTQAKRALLLKSSQQVPNLPVNLVGREKLLQETLELLQKGERVLLHGFGGMGKTALAATVTKNFLDGKRTALWMQVGSDNPDVIFDALAQPFEAGQDIAQAEDKTKALQEVLQKQRLSLLVLDDVWNAYTLSKVIEALPKGLPLLVTSRQRYPKLTKVYVDRLERGASLELLAHYALPPLTGEVAESQHSPVNAEAGVLEMDSRLSDRGVLRSQDGHIAKENPPVLDSRGTKSTSSVDMTSPPVRGGKSEEGEGANQLCELLGDHPFALRLAGLALQENGVTPERLFEQIKNNPHDFKMPGELREVGRESVASLLSVSLETLEDRAYETFLCYGLLEAPVASAGFLASCLDRDVNLIEDALFSLLERGLAERISKAGSDLVSYRIHDLAHSYAKANRFQRMGTLVRSSLTFLKTNKDAVELLDIDISNILAAVQIVKEQKLEDKLIDFMYFLVAEGSYYIAKGHTRRSIDFLKLAATVAQAHERKQEAHYLYSNLGDYYQNFIGNFDYAVEYYQKALTMAHDLGDKGREAVLLGIIGQVKCLQNKMIDSDVYIEKAHQLAKSNGDDYYLNMVLGQVSYIASYKGDWEKANTLLRESLELMDKLDVTNTALKRSRERFFALLNLGETEHQLGNFEEGLIVLGKAFELAEQESNQVWMAHVHQEIGKLHHYANHQDLVKQHMDHALELFEQNNATRDAKEVLSFLKANGYSQQDISNIEGGN
jgi:DNA-binding SARP family transcriptional activator